LRWWKLSVSELEAVGVMIMTVEFELNELWYLANSSENEKDPLGSTTASVSMISVRCSCPVFDLKNIGSVLAINIPKR
jgi:hypothetical protein